MKIFEILEFLEAKTIVIRRPCRARWKLWGEGLPSSYPLPPWGQVLPESQITTKKTRSLYTVCQPNPSKTSYAKGGSPLGALGTLVEKTHAKCTPRLQNSGVSTGFVKKLDGA